ncbi:Hypothetical predicted protein, partial [Marmota monax]
NLSQRRGARLLQETNTVKTPAASKSDLQKPSQTTAAPGEELDWPARATGQEEAG